MEVFQFRYKRPANDQTDATCVALSKELCEFVATLVARPVDGFAYAWMDPLVVDRHLAVGEFAEQEVEG